MPYTYTIAHEAIDGLPMIRAIEKEPYEFLYGSSILVAPIYQNTAADAEGNDIRNNINLPEGQWVDWFTGVCYEGGRIINHFAAPLWKLPVFVRRGSIIPMTAPHNNPNQVTAHARTYLIYPLGHSEFTSYDDDGRTQAYLRGECATTRIVSNLNVKGRLTVTVEPTCGTFAGMEKLQTTEFRIPISSAAKKMTLKANGKKIAFTSVLEPFSPENSSVQMLRVTTASPLDISSATLQLVIDGYTFDTSDRQLKQVGTLVAPTFLTDDFEEGHVSPSAYTLPLKWTSVENADYYEIEHLGRIYSTITSPSFTLEGLQPETNYDVRLRAVNREGKSEWTSEKFRTSPDPLRFAIRGITAEASIPDQPGQGIKHLFDFDESTTWHTAWDKPQSTPFDMILDLHVITQIDSLRYVPRPDGGNGTFAQYSVSYSLDKQSWTPFVGGKNEGIAIRYLRIHVEKSRGGFGSGQQIYVFRNPEAEMMIPGDINHDNRIDENDFTSYLNYTGLRQGDGDFEGYISRGDLNQNGLIDAYDISTVGIELESGVSSRRVAPVAGSLLVTSDKKQVNVGDVVTLTVSGQGLVSVNALSFALPYDATQWEYVGIEASGMKEMRNLTYDRLHTNGQKALYPTFVNCGEHPYLEGDGTLMLNRFRAKQKTQVNLTPQDGMMLDKYLNVINR